MVGAIDPVDLPVVHINLASHVLLSFSLSSAQFTLELCGIEFGHLYSPQVRRDGLSHIVSVATDRNTANGWLSPTSEEGWARAAELKSCQTEGQTRTRRGLQALFVL